MFIEKRIHDRIYEHLQGTGDCNFNFETKLLLILKYWSDTFYGIMAMAAYFRILWLAFDKYLHECITLFADYIRNIKPSPFDNDR